MKKGFVLLYTVIVISIVSVIAAGVFDIVIKEIILSESARESRISFYAADTGVECLFYWDIKHPGFNNTVFATSSNSTPPTSGVVCAGTDIASGWTISNITSSSATTQFELNYPDGSCSSVSVAKSNGSTVIESRGYNVSCGSDSSQKVERGLKVTY